jgi:tRNA(Ile)-lysidine synthase
MNVSLFDQLDRFVTEHALLPPNSTIVIGLSGGPDSVCLLHLLLRYKKEKNLTLIAAHLDHEWRENSHDDAQFCTQLAQELDITCVVNRASELPITVKKNGSQEEIGRTMRRYFLQQVREQYNADYIALGHHAQDQQETFFIRLVRGATLSGLTAMRPKVGTYIRPLLETNKTDIVAYLDDRAIAYRIDPTNKSESFLRNRIRMNVLPALQASDHRFDHNFLRTLTSLQETEEFLATLTQQTFASLLHPTESIPMLSLVRFKALSPYMQNRILIHWLIVAQVPFTPSLGLLQEITRFLRDGTHNSHSLHATWTIAKNNEFFHIIHHRVINSNRN